MRACTTCLLLFVVSRVSLFVVAWWLFVVRCSLFVVRGSLLLVYLFVVRRWLFVVGGWLCVCSFVCPCVCSLVCLLCVRCLLSVVRDSLSTLIYVFVVMC